MAMEKVMFVLSVSDILVDHEVVDMSSALIMSPSQLRSDRVIFYDYDSEQTGSSI